MFVAHLSGFSEAEEPEVKGASTTFLVFLYLLLSLLLFNLEVVHVLRSSLASFTYWMRASYVEAHPGSENAALPASTFALSSSSFPLHPPSSTATRSPSLLSSSSSTFSSPSSISSDSSTLLLSPYSSSPVRPRPTASTAHFGTPSLPAFPPSASTNSSPSAPRPASEPR